MFELWPLSLLMFFVAFVSYLFIWDAKKRGSMWMGIWIPRISKKTHPDYYSIWIFFRWVGVFIFIIFGLIMLSIDVPESYSGPVMSSAEFEEMLIGNWTGESMRFDEKIELTIRSDYTCQATYNGSIYNGQWKDDTDEYTNSVKFTWIGEKLRIPSPFADMEGFADHYIISDGDCHYWESFMTSGGVIFSKNN
jgi:hypothetical protein